MKHKNYKIKKKQFIIMKINDNNAHPCPVTLHLTCGNVK